MLNMNGIKPVTLGTSKSFEVTCLIQKSPCLYTYIPRFNIKLLLFVICVGPISFGIIGHSNQNTYTHSYSLIHTNTHSMHTRTRTHAYTHLYTPWALKLPTVENFGSGDLAYPGLWQCLGAEALVSGKISLLPKTSGHIYRKRFSLGTGYWQHKCSSSYKMLLYPLLLDIVYTILFYPDTHTCSTSLPSNQSSEGLPTSGPSTSFYVP